MFDAVYRAGSAAVALNHTEGRSARASELMSFGTMTLAGGVTAAALGAYQGYKKEMPQILGLDLDGVLGVVGLGLRAAMIYRPAGGKWGDVLADVAGGVGLGGGLHWCAVQGNIYGVNKAATAQGDVGTGVDYGRAGARELPADRQVRHEPPRHHAPAQVQFGSMFGMI